ncbi:MAG: hypothetical protein DMD82_15775 [Candidatus Rokuibacteriota bacterium]|nr:MAG: hypothetical protein DMD82_15775 [Candidatus Rokubacteria bacterium]
MGDSLMFINNNEYEVLGLFSRYPGTSCQDAIYSFNAHPHLGLVVTSSDSSADIEACVKMVDSSGVRIYWSGSMSNSKAGNLRPDRSRLFATTVVGDGTGSPPYTLTYVGRYDKLRDDILAWDQNNLHGLGANYFGLVASAANNAIPQSINGFNLEGLTLAPDGKTAYLGFRAPMVNPSGPTTSTSPRTHALIIPLLNMPDLVKGNPTPGPGAAHFGTPILLPLGVRGIRSIDYTYPGQYLITAGPYDAVSNPPVAPLNFRLFTWSGDPLYPPIERSATFAATYSPEGCIVPNTHLIAQTVVDLINDDGGIAGGCWRSMTCTIGPPADPLAVPLPPTAAGDVHFSRSPAPNPARRGMSLAITVPRAQWVELSIDDVAGRRLTTLWRGDLSAGEHTFSWNGMVNAEHAQAGLYWVRLRSGNLKEAKPFVLTP